MNAFLNRTVLALVLVTGFLAATAQTAAPEIEGMVVLESSHDVTQTVEQLKGALEQNGLMVAAEIDHSANAEGAGLELPPTYLVIFGNPQAGTPLMQAGRSIAIDLPQKMLVWRDAGTVYVAYNDPAYLAERHGLDPESEGVMNIAAALSGLAEAATAP